MMLTLKNGPADGRLAPVPIYTDDLIPFYFYTIKEGVVRHYFSLYDLNGSYMETIEAARGTEGEIFMEGDSLSKFTSL